jgi:hypothetical protein
VTATTTARDESTDQVRAALTKKATLDGTLNTQSNVLQPAEHNGRASINR